MSDETKDIIVGAKTTLDADIAEVVKDIVEEKDYNKLKDLTNLFNMNQVKKNALRIASYDELLDKIGAEMVGRIDAHPDSFSNDELVKYANAASAILTKANEQVGRIEEVPPIQLNQQNNTVNVNVGINELDRESRERVLSAVRALLDSTNIDKN